MSDNKEEVNRLTKIRIYQRLSRRFGEKAFLRGMRSGRLVRAVCQRAMFGRL